MLHLSLSPCTDYRLWLASSSRHWCLHIEQPEAQHPPTSTHYYESTSPPEVWDPLVTPRGTITERLKITLQNILIHFTLTFMHLVDAFIQSDLQCIQAIHVFLSVCHSLFLAGRMIFPPLSEILDFILNVYIYIYIYINLCLSFYLFLPFLACTYLNNAWNLLLRALPLSVCLFKKNRFMYFPIVSRFW